MNYQRLHSWMVDIHSAVKIQEELKKRIILDFECRPVRKIAGVDVAFFGDKIKAAVCVFGFPKLNLIEVKAALTKATFPYVPGFLTFREGPAVLRAFRKIKNTPDVVLFDGQGICHPRRLGIATHLGILLDTPSIGCAKTFLYGEYKPPQKTRGAYSLIRDKNTDEVLGVALCTRTNVKPIFVSCGHKITLKQAKELVLATATGFRIPEPLRYAHRLASRRTAR